MGPVVFTWFVCVVGPSLDCAGFCHDDYREFRDATAWPHASCLSSAVIGTCFSWGVLYKTATKDVPPSATKLLLRG